MTRMIYVLCTFYSNTRDNISDLQMIAEDLEDGLRTIIDATFPVDVNIHFIFATMSHNSILFFVLILYLNAAYFSMRV